jgi:hypothetical protein
MAILARESIGARGVGFDTTVVGTQTGDHFAPRLHKQEKADAKENTDGRARDEPGEDKVEQVADRTPLYRHVPGRW